MAGGVVGAGDPPRGVPANDGALRRLRRQGAPGTDGRTPLSVQQTVRGVSHVFFRSFDPACLIVAFRRPMHCVWGTSHLEIAEVILSSSFFRF